MTATHTQDIDATVGQIDDLFAAGADVIRVAVDSNKDAAALAEIRKTDDATSYMKGPEYAADSVGPQFDPERLLADHRAGASVEELSDRSWALKAELPDPMPALMGAS